MNWHSVLKSRIPLGGFGRHLTRSECTALRQLGIRCSESWVVVRYHNAAFSGVVYRPARNGGYDHAGVYVKVV
jgi:hypothetical protein